MKTRFKKIFRLVVLKHRQLFIVLLAIILFTAGWRFGIPSNSSEQEIVSDKSDEIWTCSMHPQIRQPNFGLCPICEMDLIPLKDTGEGGIREVSISKEAAALLNLQVSPVIRSVAATEISLFGRIAYDERRISAITTRIGGRIDRLFVDFTGARVKKGDHLAEIYSPEIYVAQREIIEATKAVQNQASKISETARETRLQLLYSAREKLRLLQLSEEQINEIASQEKPQDRITIRSPQDGIVVSKPVNIGSYIKTGDLLFKVADLSQVWLVMEAYESDIPWLRYAQNVAFTIDAIPGEKFHGRIVFIDPNIDPMTRVAKVRVNVDNINQKLKPGMFAKAEVKSQITSTGKVLDPSFTGKWVSPMHPEIVKDEPGQCDICGMDLVPAEKLDFIGAADINSQLPLLIPASAVLQTGKRAVVYVRIPEKADPTFEGREIILGAKVGNQFIVRSGLSEGELVVSQGAFKIDSELQIKAKPSMMNPSAGLVEKPANSAPENLAGQWKPVLRSLARLQETEDSKTAKEAIDKMVIAIQAINKSSFQPDTLQLWNEFSNRLINSLTIARLELPENIEQAARIATRSTEEAGRYLGLSSQTTTPKHIDPNISKSLEHLIKLYLPLAEALAKDSSIEAQSAANNFAKHSNMLKLTDDANYLLNNALALASNNDIKKQRELFQKISDRLILLVNNYSLDEVGSVYVVHCPMAFENKGGDWLSSIPEVFNPYFGNSMINCGAVTTTLSLGDLPPRDKMKEMNPHKHDH